MTEQEQFVEATDTNNVESLLVAKRKTLLASFL